MRAPILTVIFITFWPLPVLAQDPTRSLSLPDAIREALQHNPNIEVERISVDIAEESVDSARGFHDTTLSFSPSLEDRNVPVSSVLQGAGGKLSEDLFRVDFSAVKALPETGGRLSFRFENARTSSTNLFVNLNPFVQSQFVAAFEQPLIRNRSTDTARNRVRVSQKTVELSESVFEERVVEVVSEVQRAYWSLVFARRDLEVREEAVVLAQRQLEMNRRMVSAGALAQVEISAAVAELERRRGDSFAARSLVTQAENRIRSLISQDRASSWWSVQIMPVGGDLPAPPLTPLSDAVESALQQRPELRSMESRLEINGINLQLRQDQTKPRLDLVASYGQTGLAGSLRAEENPFSSLNDPLFERVNQLSQAQGLGPIQPQSLGVLPSFLIGGYGSTLSNLFDTSFRTVQVGVKFDLTPRNRTAQAELAKVSLERRQLQSQRKLSKMLIEADVRNVVDALETARQRLEASRAEAGARQEKLASETRLFENGESTNFLVLTRQNEYSEARVSQVRARADLNLAVAEYHRAVGGLLETWGISLQ